MAGTAPTGPPAAWRSRTQSCPPAPPAAPRLPVQRRLTRVLPGSPSNPEVDPREAEIPPRSSAGRRKGRALPQAPPLPGGQAGRSSADAPGGRLPPGLVLGRRWAEWRVWGSAMLWSASACTPRSTLGSPLPPISVFLPSPEVSSLSVGCPPGFSINTQIYNKKSIIC